ncbi:hypothetical protein ACF1BU_23950 [Streptomyces sp. NPDC014724]|uniref:hypothetical protein n=1 Tax=unclassified Streptomyces TaxID=2593676 RepID=UPI0036F79700
MESVPGAGRQLQGVQVRVLGVPLERGRDLDAVLRGPVDGEGAPQRLMSRGVAQEQLHRQRAAARRSQAQAQYRVAEALVEGRRGVNACQRATMCR